MFSEPGQVEGMTDHIYSVNFKSDTISDYIPQPTFYVLYTACRAHDDSMFVRARLHGHEWSGPHLQMTHSPA